MPWELAMAWVSMVAAPVWAALAAMALLAVMLLAPPTVWVTVPVRAPAA